MPNIKTEKSLIDFYLYGFRGVGVTRNFFELFSNGFAKFDYFKKIIFEKARQLI